MAFALFAQENVDVAVIEVDFSNYMLSFPWLYTILLTSLHANSLLSSLFMSETLENGYNSDVLFLWKQTGLGGARDATNVISSSNLLASVITTIGEEHMDALGGSLESIAMAKSGIVKHGRPVRSFLLLICVTCF